MSKKIKVIFDSSALESNKWRELSHDYKYLVRLSMFNPIQLCASEIAINEYASKLQAQVVENLELFKKSIKILSNAPALQSIPSINRIFTKTIRANAFNDLNVNNEELSILANTTFELNRKHIITLYKLTELSIHPDDAKHVMNNYFNGGGNFTLVKNRNDIPDGFIYQNTLNQLNRKDEDVYFISKDNALSKALKKINHITVLTGVPELLISLKPFLASCGDSLIWFDKYHLILESLRGQKKQLWSRIADDADDYIMQMDIVHNDIPSHFNHAFIDYLGLLKTVIEWESVEVLGDGLIGLRIKMIANIELEFDIHPSFASVDNSWFEINKTHNSKPSAFNAKGTRSALISGYVVLFYPNSSELETTGIDFLNVKNAMIEISNLTVLQLGKELIGDEMTKAMKDDCLPNQ